ncbi:hypothetical protein BZG36_01157 [Bifiguratus adelaidae]|uniref:Uncharacterized protein n=1 Tax=Bifiguratus adelaidae TaxID=1938954 RepID=A0A261Y5W6_9FUNG|nr:hypothetical protein BZG36_01157 [Bifiguratus adelaidae]
MKGFTFISAAVLAVATVPFSQAAPNYHGHGGNQWDNVRSKIKNVVVVMLEIDNLRNIQYCNYENATITSSTKYCANPKANNIVKQDPDHGIPGVSYQIYSTFHPTNSSKGNMGGFVDRQARIYGNGDPQAALDAYSPEHLPVFNQLAQEFALFDRYFASVPGPTNPNRAYHTSGTSAGVGSNDNTFSDFTNLVPGYNRTSIFELLSKHGKTWKNYYEGYYVDGLFYNWVQTKAPEQLVPASQFYLDAAEGKLPQFSYYNPECCILTSGHPPTPLTNTETLVKSMYEAIRNGPQWEETLLLINFDEHGGFADHVVPPPAPNPDGLTYTATAPDGKNFTFGFDRLGVRVPMIAISPWIERSLVVSEGTKPEAGSAFEHSSVLSFLENLFEMPHLTKRTAWAETFEGIIGTKLRNDAPKKLVRPVSAWGPTHIVGNLNV